MPTSHNDELDPIVRLDNEELDVVVYDQNDDIKDISSDTLVFEARIKANDPEPLISKTTDDPDQITITDAPNGEATIHILPADTSSLTRARVLFCTLSVIDVADRSSSILFNIPVEYRA